MNLATHNGTVTVLSTATGEHRTFRVWTSTGEFAKGERIVSLLTGPDNQTDYKAFAFLKTYPTSSGPVVKVHCWRRHQGTKLEQYGTMLERLDDLERAGKVEVMAETCCRRCNRELTTPESIASGIGPVCAGKEF